LRPVGAHAPPVEAVCPDPAVIGAPFYVMSWVEGFMADNPSAVAQVLPDPAAREAAAFSLVDCLAQFHRLDIDAIGLGDLGPREGYLTRQLKRLRAVWDKTKTRELPIIERLHSRFLARMPPQRYTGLVHADYRLGNTIVDRAHKVKAVLDWELCALGDVLSDVGALLSNWDLPEDDWPDVWMERAPTRAGGFPSREALVERYAAATGFELTALDYYRAFSYWRIAIIAEGMKRRYEAGAMGGNSSDIGKLDLRVRARADLADRFLTLAEA
jgi:aminoglycoside phosphotransferase (APT) family kinase protein